MPSTTLSHTRCLLRWSCGPQSSTIYSCCSRPFGGQRNLGHPQGVPIASGVRRGPRPACPPFSWTGSRPTHISPRKFHPEFSLNRLKVMNETLNDNFSPQNRTEGSEVGETALEYVCRTCHTDLAETREGLATLVPVYIVFWKKNPPCG